MRKPEQERKDDEVLRAFGVGRARPGHAEGAWCPACVAATAPPQTPKRVHFDGVTLSLRMAQLAAARVQGPQLGDASAPLVERCAAFSARLRAFRGK